MGKGKKPGDEQSSKKMKLEVNLPENEPVAPPAEGVQQEKEVVKEDEGEKAVENGKGKKKNRKGGQGNASQKEATEGSNHQQKEEEGSSSPAPPTKGDAKEGQKQATGASNAKQRADAKESKGPKESPTKKGGGAVKINRSHLKSLESEVEEEKKEKQEDAGSAKEKPDEGRPVAAAPSRRRELPKPFVPLIFEEKKKDPEPSKKKRKKKKKKGTGSAKGGGGGGGGGESEEDEKSPGKAVGGACAAVSSPDSMAGSSSPTSEFHLTVLRQDLFDCPDNWSLAHCVSEDLQMGKGIAVIFKKMFRGVPELLAQQKKTGEVAVLSKNGRFIYYLVTKRVYSHKPTYQSLRKSLEAMKEHCLAHHVTHLAMPKIGCGLDRLDWGEVEDMIRDIFQDTDLQITVCEI